MWGEDPHGDHGLGS